MRLWRRPAGWLRHCNNPLVLPSTDVIMPRLLLHTSSVQRTIRPRDAAPVSTLGINGDSNAHLIAGHDSPAASNRREADPPHYYDYFQLWSYPHRTVGLQHGNVVRSCKPMDGAGTVRPPSLFWHHTHHTCKQEAQELLLGCHALLLQAQSGRDRSRACRCCCWLKALAHRRDAANVR